MYLCVKVIFCQNNRIHAFVPGLCTNTLEGQFIIGKICIIKNFSVQDYKQEDKFRCLKKDVQLIFSNVTKIQVIEDDGRSIVPNAFDFVDHCELMAMTKQTMYLAG